MAGQAAVKSAEIADVSGNLSDLHAMLARIERQTSGHHINRIINHDDVYPWVKGWNVGPLDISAIVARPENVLLMGEHGGLVFRHIQPGIYEVHTSILKSGRGAWAVLMARACLHWMFTRTDAVEVVTRVPKGNLGARALTRLCGFEYEFTRSAKMEGWVYQGDPVPADIFSLTIQKWSLIAPGLVERGRWFHDRLEKEFARLGKTEPQHDDDEVHDRFVGMAVEMIFGGVPMKGQIFYNRWATMAGYGPVLIETATPLTVDIGNALLCFKRDDFWVMLCR